MRSGGPSVDSLSPNFLPAYLKLQAIPQTQIHAISLNLTTSKPFDIAPPMDFALCDLSRAYQFCLAPLRLDIAPGCDIRGRVRRYPRGGGCGQNVLACRQRRPFGAFLFYTHVPLVSAATRCTGRRSDHERRRVNAHFNCVPLVTFRATKAQNIRNDLKMTAG